MYTVRNYKSKKELLADFNAGKRVEVFYPGIQGPESGSNSLEGPHYPQPHKWYASCTFENMVLVTVDGKRPKPPKVPAP
jgi:hypothetical protein